MTANKQQTIVTDKISGIYGEAPKPKKEGIKTVATRDEDEVTGRKFKPREGSPQKDEKKEPAPSGQSSSESSSYRYSAKLGQTTEKYYTSDARPQQHSKSKKSTTSGKSNKKKTSSSFLDNDMYQNMIEMYLKNMLGVDLDDDQL